MATDFLAGCLGGCAGVAVGHPFDTIKVRMQTQDFRNPKYRGAWHCATSIVKHESVRGLFKGMSSPMAGVAAVNAIIFGVHGNITRHMRDPDSLRSQVMAGSAAGFVQAFVTSPMELIKTRLQVLESTQGPLQCAKNILMSEGVKGIFRGQAITICRDVPAFGTYFLTYEYLTRRWAGHDGLPSAPAVLMAGGMAGVMSWVLTYPIDVIKTRLQCDSIGGTARYRGILHCVRVGLAEEGHRSLTRGMAPTLLRAFPVNAATFAVVTWTLRMFSKEVVEEGDAWREVLSLGDGLVDAAVNVPAMTQFQHKHLHPFSYNLLPQVLQDSRGGERACEEGGARSDGPRLGLWATYDQLISGRRCPFLAIHRLHHNLSNAL